MQKCRFCVNHVLWSWVTACAGMAAATPAWSAVMFSGNDSDLLMSALATGNPPFSQQLDGPITESRHDIPAIPSSFAADVSAMASAGNSTASGAAAFAVDIQGNANATVTIVTDFSYDTSAMAGAGDEFNQANAEGAGDVQLMFDLDAPYFFEFTANNVSASGTAAMEIQLRDPSGPDPINETIANETRDLNFSGMLPAGSNYVISFNIDDDAVTVVSGDSAISSISLVDATLVLRPVPTPATLPLIVVGGLGMLNRRRR